MTSHFYNGPYLYCDYWASVLGLRGLMNPGLLKRQSISLSLFRNGLDRPQARLPKLRYYLITFLAGPLFLAHHLTAQLGFILRSRVKVDSSFQQAMSRFQLRLDPQGENESQVRVSSPAGDPIGRAMNPDRMGVVASLFYPTYKVFIASLMTILFTVILISLLDDVEFLSAIMPFFEVLTYPLLLAALYLIFRDLLTAVLAPMPVFAVRFLMHFSGTMPPESWGPLLLGMGGCALIFYLAEWFFVPRPLPPTLYFYINDPDDGNFPYRPEHAPYWLRGRQYWVWRFVTLFPAELNKPWEPDWERLEVWVRADPGDQMGMIEWLVTDLHYRELWMDYRRLVPEKDRRRHQQWLARHWQGRRNGIWLLESDAHLVYHSQFVRGIFPLCPEKGWIWKRLWELIRSAKMYRARDRRQDFLWLLRDLEISGQVVLGEIPEHLRKFSLRELLTTPWDYWRFPEGVSSARISYLYGPNGTSSPGGARANEPTLQIKEIARRLQRSGVGEKAGDAERPPRGCID
jgi:hypothetical protein